MLFRLRFYERQIAEVIAMTEQVVHDNDADCVGCGCRSLTAVEAVVYALREKDELIRRQRDRIACRNSEGKVG